MLKANIKVTRNTNTPESRNKILALFTQSIASHKRYEEKAIRQGFTSAYDVLDVTIDKGEHAVINKATH